MPSCYLTIDDSPSPHTIDMIDFLNDRGISSLIFCRGDMIETHGDHALIYAIKHGHVLANHGYSHTRFSQMNYTTCIDEIEKTEHLINTIYDQANIKRPGKYFRFPHIDRGAGGHIVDYKTFGSHQDFVSKLFTDGINVDPTPPSIDMIKKKDCIQGYLSKNGFTQPFEKITYPWFQHTEMETAKDCLYTFSTSDWMMLNRHKGNWIYKTTGDLKQKIIDDPWLSNSDSHSIILAHDKPEAELLPVFKSLVDFMIVQSYKFIPINPYL